MKYAHFVTCCALATVCLYYPAQGFARPETADTMMDGDKESAPGFVHREDAAASMEFDRGVEAGSSNTSPPAGTMDMGHATPNPYKAMIDELVAAPKARKGSPDETSRSATKPPEQNTLFYDENELKSRIDTVKSTVSSMFESEAPTTQSEEERELALQRDIAMRDAYRGTRLAGGTDALGSTSGSGAQQATAQDKAAKVRLAELAFLAWDLLTHPLTIALLVLYATARLLVAIFRVAKDPHGRRKKSRRSGGHSSHAMKVQTPAPANLTDFEIEQDRRRRERRHRSRRHRSRRSFLDRFRSV